MENVEMHAILLVDSQVARKRPKIVPIDGFLSGPAFQAILRAAQSSSAMHAGGDGNL